MCKINHITVNEAFEKHYEESCMSFHSFGQVISEDFLKISGRFSYFRVDLQLFE